MILEFCKSNSRRTRIKYNRKSKKSKKSSQNIRRDKKGRSKDNKETDGK